MGNQMSQEEMDVRLIQAVEKGTDDQVELLLRSGANASQPPEEHDFLSRTPLHHAALCKCDVKKLKLLLEYIRDIDVTDDAGNTAIHYAARYRNNIEFIRTLMKQKPNCKIQNSRGKTALHNAVDIGLDVKTVELLLVRGDADPNIADWNGITPLHICSSQKSCDPMVVGILLRFGADPNRRDNKGQTPLHVAAAAANVSVLLLLRYNARVFMKDDEGNLPSDVAVTDDIKNILLFEQNRLKEEGLSEEGIEYFLKSPNSNLKKKKHRGKPNGEGFIRLLDGQEILVPGQSLPSGASLELTVKPSTVEMDNSPQETFYDICLDLKLEIPGVLADNWAEKLMDSSNKTDNELKNLNKLNAFTGMCINGGEQWKSQRDLLLRPDGKACLNFRISRERSKISVGTPSTASKAESVRSSNTSMSSSSSSVSSSSSSFLLIPSAESTQEVDKTDLMKLVTDHLAENLAENTVSETIQPQAADSELTDPDVAMVSKVTVHDDVDDDEPSGVKVEKQDAFDSLVSKLSNGLWSNEKVDQSPEVENKLD